MRRTQFYSSFFISPIRYSAFHYLKNFEEIIPAEFLDVIQKHREFALEIDAVANKLLLSATCLKTIRAVYTSKTLDDEIECIIAKKINAKPDELRDVARKIIKFCARERMRTLGFENELDQIHRDNEKEYGNAVGPTQFFLEKKYKDEKEIAEAAKRFRSNDKISNLIK